MTVACKKTDKGQTGAARVSQAQQPPKWVQGAVKFCVGQTNLVKTKQRVADHGEVFDFAPTRALRQLS